MKQTIQVNILNKQYTLNLLPTESFENLTKILFNYLKMQWITDQNTKVQFNESYVDLQNPLKSQNLDHELTVTLSKPFEIRYKHEFFDEFNFTVNYYGTIDPFIQYVNKVINKYSVRLEAKLFVEGKEIDKTTFWCSISQKFTIVIESNINVVYNGSNHTQTANICWNLKQFLANVQKNLKIEDVVQIKVKVDDIQNKNTIFQFIQEKNPVFTINCPQIIKYQIKNSKKELLKIEIEKDKPIRDIECQLEKILKLPITKTVHLQYDGVVLVSQKTVKDYRIPYNSVIGSQIVNKDKIQLQLQNVRTLKTLILDIDPSTLLKNIDPFIYASNQNCVQYFINGEQLIDKSLTIDQLDLQQNSVLGYEIDEQEIKISNEIYLPPPSQSIKIPNPSQIKILKVRIIIDGKALNFEVDSKITVQEIIEQIKIIMAQKIKGLNHYGLSYNSQFLKPDTEIGSLSSGEVVELHFTN